MGEKLQGFVEQCKPDSLLRRGMVGVISERMIDWLNFLKEAYFAVPVECFLQSYTSKLGTL